MKVFFDTNVYVAEALLGEVSEHLLEATSRALWRIFTSREVLVEVERVMAERLDCSRRFAALTATRVRRRATLVEPAPSRHRVPDDPDDSPILQAALAAGVDYLISNDAHLLSLTPYHGLRIVSIAEYRLLLENLGLW